MSAWPPAMPTLPMSEHVQFVGQAPGGGGEELVRVGVSNVAEPMAPPLWEVTASPARSVPGMVRLTLAPGTGVQVTPSAEV